MKDGTKGRISLNKRLVYLLIFCVVALPVASGVLVWYFTKSENGTECTAAPSQPTTEPTKVESEPWKQLRLPNYIEPIHYSIRLYPDFYGDHGTFYGDETIELNIHEGTKYILIHIHGLTMKESSVRDMQKNETLSVNRTFLYEENEFWVLEMSEKIGAGSEVLVYMEFEGSLTVDIIGFYKSTYVNSITNETRYLATSKFEPVNARKAFPCLDEPSMKANFTVTLVHKLGYTALSNMPAEVPSSSADYPGLLETSFQTSVKMSTYLVCFIVCDFESRETMTSTGKQVRVFSTPDKINQTDYALEVANYTIVYYQELFGIEFPLPKCDIIAIPDFVSGAMEHWGLITFREVNIIFDEMEASPANKQRVATVIAHEMAHQWFGNIVTMDWWDDLWLNEGFASFMEYTGIKYFEKDWQLQSQFLTVDYQRALGLDSNPESHPIIVPVNAPTEINEVFDAITYSKGASIIGMLENIMGSDKFFKGIQIYLTKHKWGTAKTDDLWSALEEVPDAPPVKSIMDTWTLQMGYPYIDVQFSVDGMNHVATLQQHRFMADKNIAFNTSDSPYGYKWNVFVDYASNTGNHSIKNFDGSSVSEHLDVDPGNDSVWVKLNHLQTGFYRVNYPDAAWRKFGRLLTETHNVGSILEPVDRAGLLDDVFNLAKSGYLKYDVALDLAEYLRVEDEYLPWVSAYGEIFHISSMLHTSAAYGKWRKFILSLVSPHLDRLGWQDTGSHLERRNRINLMSLSCYHGDIYCLGNATQIFREWIDDGVSVSPALRRLVYRYGMHEGGTSDDWEKMWNKFAIETIPQERINLLYGISHTSEEWLLSRLIDFTKDDSKIRSQDISTVLNYVSSTSTGNRLVWDWTRANWHYLVERFTVFSRWLGRLVPGIVSGFNSEFKLKEVERFFTENPDAGSGARGRKQAVESIKSNIAWMEQNERTISDWLNKKTL